MTTSVEVAAVRDCSSPRSKTLTRDQVGRRHPEPRRHPGGHREPADLAQEAVRSPRALARGEREEERRDADRERADDREVTREQRILDGRDPDRDDQERREHRLRDEELRHALDVAEDPAALGDHRRDRREVAVDEHDVGDGLRHLRARSPARSRGATPSAPGTSLTPSPTIAT